jgi:hypothetical protein
MVYCRKRYRDSDTCTRTCCNLLFLILSIGAIILCVLGILCLADRGGIGYCTSMTVGSFVSLLVFGIVLAAMVTVMLFCIGCCMSAVDNI